MNYNQESQRKCQVQSFVFCSVDWVRSRDFSASTQATRLLTDCFLPSSSAIANVVSPARPFSNSVSNTTSSPTNADHYMKDRNKSKFIKISTPNIYSNYFYSHYIIEKASSEWRTMRKQASAKQRDQYMAL